MNLIEGLNAEIARVKDELLPEYYAIGQAGSFGAMMLQNAVTEGQKAIESDDTVRMVRALRALQECE